MNERSLFKHPKKKKYIHNTMYTPDMYYVIYHVYYNIYYIYVCVFVSV